VTVTDALRRRISIRSFKSTPLQESLVRDILDVARWAPSGGNLQPWKVIVIAGSERDSLVTIAKNRAADAPDESSDRPVYPPNLWEPYRTRRFKVGEDLYALLGIPRTDRAARLRRFASNYEFFGAPIGMFFIVDERMGYGQWAHLGMFMQSIALAAWERGVATCMQEAWATLRSTLKSHFRLPANELVYCGMALGYADDAAAVNSLRSERAPIDDFAQFLGFQEF
jgi:nitroreductase